MFDDFDFEGLNFNDFHFDNFDFNDILKIDFEFSIKAMNILSLYDYDLVMFHAIFTHVW